MASLTVYTGLIDDCQAIIDNVLESCTAHLFQSVWTPALDDENSDYAAIEVDWTGYTAQATPAWTAPAIDGSDRAVTYSGVIEFPCTGDPTGQQAYGYWLEHSSVLHHAQVFDSPIPAVEGVPIAVIFRYFVKNPA